MFNKISSILKKTGFIIASLILVFSCKNEVNITFIEHAIETSAEAEVSINYPKAEGSNEVTNRINETLQNYVVNQINLSDEPTADVTLDNAAKQFNNEFIRFKNDFPDATQKWEAFIDGEVTYRSPDLICIAINSYLDTGGAHGNSMVKFFNFDAETGALISKKDLINDAQKLSELIKTKLQEEIDASSNEDSMEDMFFGKDFELPESLGYSDEGLIILYNPYEIASYAQGIIEFTIPYDEVSPFLLLY